MQSMRRALFVLLTACGGGGGFPDAPPVDGPTLGAFSAMWSVVDQNNQPISCDRIGGQTMTVLVHNKAFDGGSTQIFTCGTGMGTSQAILTGTYKFDFELGGTVGLLAKSSVQDNVDIAADTTTPLQPLLFQVKATGGLALNLSAGDPGGNCESGANIQSFTISATHNSDATCEPLTLAIAAGATKPAHTYTIDCTTPVETNYCIETDQQMTVTNVPSDGYTMHIRGKVAGQNCYKNDDSIQVPPLDMTLTRTLNLARQTQITGC